MELKIIPVIQVIICLALMVLSRYIFNTLSYQLTGVIPITSVLFLIAILVALFAITSFRKHQTTVNPSKPETASIIVNTGIYAFSRNPMYLAMLILVIAAALYLQNIVAMFIIPMFIAYITRYQIVPEENALTLLFGEEYENYKKKVRRWI